MREDGGIHPAELTRPALRSECIDYYDAFRYLGASRMWSQVGPLPISVSDIAAFLFLNNITNPDERMKYLRLVQAMDRVELKFLQEKTKRAAK